MNKAVEILKNNLLTPIIYMMEEEDSVTFIGFFDTQTTVRAIYETQEAIETVIDRPVHIVDIRDFNEADRLELIKSCETVYTESPMVKSIFESAMVEDLRQSVMVKNESLVRLEKTGSPYVS